jgi:hypothetical protein
MTTTSTTPVSKYHLLISGDRLASNAPSSRLGVCVPPTDKLGFLFTNHDGEYMTILGVETNKNNVFEISHPTWIYCDPPSSSKSLPSSTEEDYNFINDNLYQLHITRARLIWKSLVQYHNFKSDASKLLSLPTIAFLPSSSTAPYWQNFSHRP